jgi:hypothetical protein
MSKNDGGPAFPIETTATPYAPGMSLRDWFAGQALAGIMSNCTGDGRTTWLPESAAFHAYSVADAMLKARGQ